MAKRCLKCGNVLDDYERFCPRCGENMSFASPEPQVINTSSSYQNYQNKPVDKSEMTFGQWVLTIIVTNLFSIISIIFLFVWGFGDGPESRKNYCKAMLIVKAISVGLSVIFMFFYFGIFGVLFGKGLSNGYYSYDDYSNPSIVQEYDREPSEIGHSGEYATGIEIEDDYGDYAKVNKKL